MKKILSLLLVLTLVLTSFVGCGKKEKTEKPAEKTTKEQKAESKDDEQKEEDKVVVKQEKPFHVLMNQVKPGWPQSLEEDVIRQYVQEKSGFEYKLEAYSGADYKTKLQLLLASGEYPDIWFGNGADIAKWKKAGLIIPLDELLEKYGKDLQGVLHEKSLAGSTIDGQLWSLPQGWNQEDPTAGPLTDGLVLRKDWLANVGLDMPTTLDEYYEVLKAFTFNDPDKNGKNDTYGLSSVNWMFGHVYSAFGTHPGDWYERDGKLVIGEMTDEFKEAVKLLAKWYAEGLIDPEFPVYTKGKQLEEKLISSMVGSTYGHVWMAQSTWSLETAAKAMTPEADFMMVPAVEGANGVRGYRAPKYAKGNGLVISSQAKNPELIMQFLNWYAQDENWLATNLGIEGTHWNFKDDARSQIEFIDDWGVAKKKFTVGIGNPNRVYRIADRRHSPQDLLDAMKQVTKYTLPNEFEGTVPAMKDYAQLEKIVQQTVIKVIIGADSADELDKMQERWYKEGGTAITDEVNAIWSK